MSQTGVHAAYGTNFSYRPLYCAWNRVVATSQVGRVSTRPYFPCSYPVSIVKNGWSLALKLKNCYYIELAIQIPIKMHQKCSQPAQKCQIFLGSMPQILLAHTCTVCTVPCLLSYRGDALVCEYSVHLLDVWWYDNCI